MNRSDFETLSLLVVDDEPLMRKLIKSMLNSLGVKKIVLAASGEEALSALRSNPIDIVTCDYDMQPMNGTELVRRLRCDHSHPARKVPIVMVTANAQREVVIDARDSGANEYITKPLSANALKSRLVRALVYEQPFIDIQKYAGPDRRRSRAGVDYTGPKRRKTDVECDVPILGVED